MKGSLASERVGEARLQERLQASEVPNPGANLKSLCYRCYFREAAFEWELTKDTIDLPLSCLQGKVKGSLAGERVGEARLQERLQASQVLLLLLYYC